MWRVQNTLPLNVLSEILVRIVLLIIVCVMNLNFTPHMWPITEKEFDNYKRPRRESIIQPWAIVTLVVFIPVVGIFIYSKLTRNYTGATQALLAWTLACAINAFITETGKLIVGRPRPDFFYRCFPNGKVTKDLQCTGSAKEVLEGRKSFPSGHSSFAFCSLGFISVWMSGVLEVFSRCRGRGLRVVACLAPLVLAAVIAVSRCWDNHHHWEDVVVGSIVGFFSSYFCYRQYFHPLDSEDAGIPYADVLEDEIFCVSSQECCTSHVSASTTSSCRSNRIDKKCM